MWIKAAAGKGRKRKGEGKRVEVKKPQISGKEPLKSLLSQWHTHLDHSVSSSVCGGSRRLPGDTRPSVSPCCSLHRNTPACIPISFTALYSVCRGRWDFRHSFVTAHAIAAIPARPDPPVPAPAPEGSIQLSPPSCSPRGQGHDSQSCGKSRKKRKEKNIRQKPKPHE